MLEQFLNPILLTIPPVLFHLYFKIIQSSEYSKVSSKKVEKDNSSIFSFNSFTGYLMKMKPDKTVN